MDNKSKTLPTNFHIHGRRIITKKSPEFPQRRRRKSATKGRHPPNPDDHQDTSESAQDRHKPTKKKGKGPAHKATTPQAGKVPPFRREKSEVSYKVESPGEYEEDMAKQRRKRKSKKRGEKGEDEPDGSQGKGSTPKKQQERFKTCEPYWSRENVDRELKRGNLIQGSIRINPKKYSESYIDNPDGGADIFIEGMHCRNRALQDDIVVVQLLPQDQWKVKTLDGSYMETTTLFENFGKTVHGDTETNVQNDSEAVLADISCTSSGSEDLQMKMTCEQVKGMQLGKSFDSLDNDSEGSSEDSSCTSENGGYQPLGNEEEGDEDSGEEMSFIKLGKVVYILEKKHTRLCRGHLKLQHSPKARDAIFSPIDSALPRLFIPLKQCPSDFMINPGKYASTLFLARILTWSEQSAFARGCLERLLGEAGAIEAETKGFLMEHGIDDSDFNKQVLQCLPDVRNWSIDEAERQRRRDLTSECIFTIDPSTARDLDDALSCKPLPDGTYEVGVHIADVSFFIEENTPLDREASLRATSVYLVQRVIPMLPRPLCEHLCSLNPNEDKLTSLMNGAARRSRSCVKLSYDHAQAAIENQPTQTITTPEIGGGFTADQIFECIRNLNKIAVNTRRARFEGGALRLDQVKLQFNLNPSTGLPEGYSVYHLKDSN
ncbi:putative DIS3-like exonuclease 2 isoform X2, partial [Apostichopus japonicus]